jgi:hypothetical protein
MNRNYIFSTIAVFFVSLLLNVSIVSAQGHKHIGKLFEEFYSNEFYDKFIKLYGVPPKFTFSENDTINDILVYSVQGIEGYEIMTRYKLENNASLVGFITMNCTKECIISKIAFYNTATTPWADVTTEVFPETKIKSEFQKKLKSLEKGKKKKEVIPERTFWIRLASKEKDIITGVVENQFKDNEKFYTSGILVFDGEKFLFSDPTKPKPTLSKKSK